MICSLTFGVVYEATRRISGGTRYHVHAALSLTHSTWKNLRTWEVIR